MVANGLLIKDEDTEACKLIQELPKDPNPSNKFVWKNDSLWYRYFLYLSNNSQLKKKVLLELDTCLI